MMIHHLSMCSMPKFLSLMTQIGNLFDACRGVLFAEVRTKFAGIVMQIANLQNRAYEKCCCYLKKCFSLIIIKIRMTITSMKTL